MSIDFWPELSEDMLLPFKLIRTRLQEDPNCLQNFDCPYDSDVTEFLQFFASDSSSDVNLDGDTDLEVGDVGEEAAKIYKEIRAFSKSLDKKNTSEFMAAYRTTTSLLEKLLTIQEKAANVKDIKDFEARVFKVIDDVLTPDQRTLVMDLLRGEESE